MSDDTSKSQGQDRQRININQAHELRDWSKKFGVSEEELKRAVAKVGDRSDAVEKELKNK